MIHLFVNALAASAGGGLTYVRNVLPHLAARKDVQVTLLINPRVRRELQVSDNIKAADVPLRSGVARASGSNSILFPNCFVVPVLTFFYSTGNFALRASPIPQILLSRNSLYTFHAYYEDLKRRGEYLLWLDTRIKGWLAKQSLQFADVTVAPSAAFAEELVQWTGKNVTPIHHGFDSDLFSPNPKSLTPAVQSRLDATVGCLRILFVSHYNYYRNFETLFKAIPLLQKHLPEHRIRLLLTCNLGPGEKFGAYRSSSAAALIRALNISENIIELGEVPYQSLHQCVPRVPVLRHCSFCGEFCSSLGRSHV